MVNVTLEALPSPNTSPLHEPGPRDVGQGADTSGHTLTTVLGTDDDLRRVGRGIRRVGALEDHLVWAQLGRHRVVGWVDRNIGERSAGASGDVDRQRYAEERQRHRGGHGIGRGGRLYKYSANEHSAEHCGGYRDQTSSLDYLRIVRRARVGLLVVTSVTSPDEVEAVVDV